MYRTLIYAVWLTSYPKLSLVPEQIILHSPISTALNDGAPGPPSFPRLLCYQLHPPMLPCTCLVSFKRPLLHPRSGQPCTASAERTILLVCSLQLIIHSHRKSWSQPGGGCPTRHPKNYLSQGRFCSSFSRALTGQWWTRGSWPWLSLPLQGS